MLKLFTCRTDTAFQHMTWGLTVVICKPWEV